MHSGSWIQLDFAMCLHCTIELLGEGWWNGIVRFRQNVRSPFWANCCSQYVGPLSEPNAALFASCRFGLLSERFLQKEQFD